MSMSQKNQTLSKSLSLYSFFIGSGSLLASATSTSGNITCVVLKAKNSFPSLPAPTCCQFLVLHTHAQKRDSNPSLLFTSNSQPLFFPLSHSCIVISDSSPQTYPTMTFLHLTAKRVFNDPPLSLGSSLSIPSLVLLPAVIHCNHLEADLVPQATLSSVPPEESILPEDQYETFVKSLFFALDTVRVT